MRMVKAEVDEEVHRRLREKRAADDTTLKEATEAVLREWCEEVNDES